MKLSVTELTKPRGLIRLECLNQANRLACAVQLPVPQSSVGGSSVQGTSLVLDGAAGVSDAFGLGTTVRFDGRLVTVFFALCGFLAGRVDRFALAFFCAAFLIRFAIRTF